MLLENLRSLAARYPSSRYADSAVLEANVSEFRIELDDVGTRPIVAMLKLIDSYVYQASEHREWEASGARRYCEDLYLCLTRELPGYAVAEWAI